MADDEPIAPEEDPEAALEALAEGAAPESPARRRRLARAALYAVRDARRSARIGIGLGVAAILVALAVGALALSRGGGDENASGQAASHTEDIVEIVREEFGLESTTGGLSRLG